MTIGSTAPAVPGDAATELVGLTRAMADTSLLADRRAALMSHLWAEGCTLDSIAEAAGVTREAVRKSVLRWRGKQI